MSKWNKVHEAADSLYRKRVKNLLDYLSIVDRYQYQTDHDCRNILVQMAVMESVSNLAEMLNRINEIFPKDKKESTMKQAEINYRFFESEMFIKSFRHDFNLVDEIQKNNSKRDGN